MAPEPSERRVSAGAVFVAVTVLGAAAGVGIWSVRANNSRPALDTSGFDLNSVSAPRPGLKNSAAPDKSPSSLAMIKGDASLKPVSEAGDHASSPAPDKAAAQQDLKQAARRNEDVVRRFSEKMSAKYPAIRQYGRDWMSYPDLRKLNDDYMRNHDPVAFLYGVAKSKNFGKLVGKYAGEPALREFIVKGVSEAPPDLTAAAGSVMSNDHVIHDLVANVSTGLGLPPSITAMISGNEPAKIKVEQVVGEALSSAQGKQGQQPSNPPVPTDR